MRVQISKGPKARLIALLAFVLMFGEWILLVAGTRRDEMIVGAASVVASGAFLLVVNRSSALRSDFQFADMARAWHIPWYIASDIVVIAIVLFRDLFGIEKARSLYCVSGFKTAKDDPVLVACTGRCVHFGFSKLHCPRSRLHAEQNAGSPTKA